VLTDERGAPLALQVSAANVNDHKALFSTLDETVVARPAPAPYHRQHLCLDKGYDYPGIAERVQARGYLPHIGRRGTGKPEAGERPHPARRWVVERTNSWHNRYRKLAVRFEKKVENYLALLELACSLIVCRLILLR
jgi:putative transposase